jgi:2-amino-4-hydroxy-6-hydroxymethyldihydropteridine diphosphokinase
MYVTAQPKFLNMACKATTALSPLEVLRKAKAIEKEMEPAPHVHNEPRVIDIDILFYGDATIATPELTIPHPRIAERAFVLVPLADVAPELVHPSLGATILELKNRLGDTSNGVRPIE